METRDNAHTTQGDPQLIPAARFITFHVPEDRAYLAAVGEVALQHVHLDYVLRLMVKSLAEITVGEAVRGTAGDGSAQLRNAVRKLGNRVFGDTSPTQIRLRALLTRCKELTRERNALMHGVFARELRHDAPTDAEMYGDVVVLNELFEQKPPPTEAELRDLASRIGTLAGQMNGERLHGFITLALLERDRQATAR